MFVDGVNDKKLVQVLAAAARDATAAADIDLTNGGDVPNMATVIVDLGVEGITLSGSNKIELTLTHGDEATPSTPVEASDIIIPANAPAGVVHAPDGAGIVMTFDANAEIPGVFAVGYRGGKSVLRASLGYEGTHSAATPSAIVAVLEGLAFKPAA